MTHQGRLCLTSLQGAGALIAPDRLALFNVPGTSLWPGPARASKACRRKDAAG